MRIVVLGIALFWGVSVNAQDSNSELSKRIDSLLLSRYNKGLFNGSVLVQKDGEVIYKRAFGWANLEQRDTLEIQAPMRIASVTKTFTAVCVLKLAQEGKIDLYKDINAYLPEIEKSGITIHHLLSHTSGIAYINGRGHDVEQYGENRGDNRTTNDDVLRYFKEQRPKPKNKVGEKHVYSNISYTILASLIERIGGMKYSAYLEQNIFIPLQMKNSFLYLPNDQNTNPEKVLSYAFNKKGFQYIRPYYSYDEKGVLKWSSDKYGDKYICSTVEDLNKFNNALINGKILNQYMLNKMLTPAKLNNNELCDSKYGYGIYQYEQALGVFYQHGGALAAFRARNMFDFKGNQFILLMNTNSYEYWRLHHAILRLIGKENEGAKPSKGQLTKKEVKFEPVFNQKYKINYEPLYD